MDAALLKNYCWARQFTSFCLKNSTGLSLCSGCVVCKWRLSLFGFKLLQVSTLRQTHGGLSSLPTVVQVKPKARYVPLYLLFFAMEGDCFGSKFGNASSSALRLHGSPIKNLSMLCSQCHLLIHSFMHSTCAPLLQLLCSNYIARQFLPEALLSKDNYFSFVWI